jgi:hypothetical protein
MILGQSGQRGLFFGGIVAVIAAAVFACGSDEENKGSSSGGTSSGGGGDAKKFFIDKVHASISESCSKCHQEAKSGAPVFLGSNAEASYTAIETFPGLLSAPNLSPLVQKGPHSGPALSSTQTDLITKWLTLEVTQRKLSADPGTPKNLRAAFKAFGACMDYARWKELKLYTIAATNTEGNQGQCRSCHNYGQASMWLAGGTDQLERENIETFLKLGQFPYVQRLVVGRVNAEGLFEGIESSRRIVDKGTEAQQQQANSHPRFSLPSDIANALNTFVLETISNVSANRCQNVTQPDAGPDAAPQE